MVSAFPTAYLLGALVLVAIAAVLVVLMFIRRD